MQSQFILKGLLMVTFAVFLLNFMIYDRKSHAGPKRKLAEFVPYNDNNAIIGRTSNPEYSQQCEPKKKIVFHKTHKCSSTTIQNILFRYTKKYGLHLALPDKGNFLGESEGFTLKFHKKSSKFLQYFQPDVFCLHNRWNREEVRKLFMPDIPLYFTILRDPVEVFISMWDYTEASKLFFENQKLEDFVMLRDPKPDQQIGQIHLNNTMMWDFGFGSEHSESISAIEQKIKEIENTFELVMIVEHFEESIVFLKHHLCWEYEDLVYLKLNAHKKEEKSSLSQEARDKLRKWLTPDQMLYDHFKALFLQKIESFGRDRMREELTKLAQSIEQFKSRCSIRQGGKNSKIKVNKNVEVCMDLVRPELKFIQELRATDLSLISQISNKTL